MKMKIIIKTLIRSLVMVLIAVAFLGGCSMKRQVSSEQLVLDDVQEPNVTNSTSGVDENEHLDESLTKTTNVAVLMYHYFNNEQDMANDPFDGITTQELENDLKYFRDNKIRTITCSELIAFIEGKIELPEKCVMITIDDGHYSIYRDFMPLAFKYGCKANVSLVGEFISDLSTNRNENVPKSMWMNWEEVEELVKSGVVELGSHTNYMHHNDDRYGIKMKQGETPEEYSKILVEDEKPLIDKIIEVSGEAPLFFAYPYSAPQGGYYNFMTEEFGFYLLLCGDEVEWSSTRGNIFVQGEGLESLSDRMIRRYGRYSGDNIEILLNSIWNNDDELIRN